MERLIKAIHINVPTGYLDAHGFDGIFPTDVVEFQRAAAEAVGAGYYLIDGNFQVRFNFGGKFRPEQIRIGLIPVSLVTP
jgi:hypothetical protein